MKNIARFLTGVFLLFLIACSKEEGKFIINNPIQPLSIGNEWTYTDSIFEEKVTTSELTIRVSSKTTLPFYEGDAFYWDIYIDGGLSKQNIVGIDSDHFYHLATIENGDTLFDQHFWARYPIEIGQHFSETRFEHLPENGEYIESAIWDWTCIAIEKYLFTNGEPVEMVIFETQPESNQVVRLSYAVNIGYAGWETINDGKTIFKETLVDYSLIR